MFSKKIKDLRRQAKMSQEKMAEKLKVSRQAVTKWETGAGIPDIENVKAIAELFHISIDELLEIEVSEHTKKDYVYDSVTEYDIDCGKNYDITFSGAKRVSLCGYKGEKIRVRLASDQIEEIQSVFKVRIDDVKKKIDIDVRRFGNMTEARAKNELDILIWIPQQYIGEAEISGNTSVLELAHIEAGNIEFSGKTERVFVHDVTGHVEINSNVDMNIVCAGLSGRLDINQISATSRLTVPEHMEFFAVKKGIGNHIYYERKGIASEDFSMKEDEINDQASIIELNGMKSELIIEKVSEPELEV
ncbi:helix-turn-helix transcriptional regulator [Anaerostipes sp.]|uniref:helix-turn-helix transcriptional regulator n=1 Tax=Anaerostipes sp. TaxID=1872530 RepID=UPI0025BF7DDD|nr:helix-turn-helix transcriptional regulator [Anaerostipes sp.]MBS7009744.1 helix-turn-helix transcriptional regulator [Anaerostipes sp.]